ncbi:MAG: hypothetical protein EpisKO_22330 [Epibacterium sp.]
MAWPARPEEWRPTLMMLVILPFWTSFLIRVYAWKGILSERGVPQPVRCCGPGVIGRATSSSSTPHTAVYIGIVYTYLPFMILPIYAALDREWTTVADRGCRGSGVFPPLQAFWLVTIPLSQSPGIIAGSLPRLHPGRWESS